jgi:hypothetical protein
VNILAGGDFDKIAGVVHPDNGMRISIDAFVDGSNDLLVSADLVRSAAGDKTELPLGRADGTGEPVHSTLAGYLRRIGALDYANVDAVGYNRVIGSGNTINNVFKYYAETIVVEFYWGGSEKYADMDWRSVRFVFQPCRDGWCLAGITEDFWTI